MGKKGEDEQEEEDAKGDDKNGPIKNLIGGSRRDEDAERIKNEGNELMMEDKFEEALVKYNQVIKMTELHPSHIYYNNRA